VNESRNQQDTTLPSEREEALRLVDVILELSTARSLARVQEVVRRAARRLTGADGATFILRDGEQCFYADEDAIAPLWKGRRFPLTACISGWAMLHREPVVIEDVFVDARVPHEAYRPTFVKSLVMVPIRTERPLGAIGVYWARVRRASTFEVRELQALADSTAIAIENITLLDELRAAKDAAEGANRLKSEFLSVLSHELRTPMTPIVSWSSVLCDAQVSEPEMREAARSIQACAESHLVQIDQLLDLAQMLAGASRMHATPTDVAAVVAAAIGEHAGAAAAKHIDLACVSTTRAHLVNGDRDRLRQAVGQLVGNAIKFTPDGGRVRVELQQDDTLVRVVVCDTGIGIAPEFAPFVFDNFRQADGSMTRSAGGMGIGLALVREIAALHGGSVGVRSPGKDQGASFTIALPRLSSPS
jgi:signal transduction histidine kinase